MSARRNRLYGHLEEIFRAALLAVDPYRLVRERVRVEGGKLLLPGEGPLELSAFERVLVLGVGKAAAAMARAVEESLGERISDGVIVVREGHGEPLERVRRFEAGHPLPDVRGLAGAEAFEQLARRADERTLVISLISGGGSALLPAPYAGPAGRVSLEDKQSVTRALLACGATIQEINCIRKHLSRLKGGRLAALLDPATTVNLILSDVVGDRLDTIASGLTVPDETTYAQGLEIVARYGLESALPPAVMGVLREGAAGRIPETPKPGDPVFRRVRNVLLGTNRVALEAAAARARELGYACLVLSSRVTGEAREVARVYAGIALETAAGLGPVAPPGCILAGGETTVTIRGQGRGGRNQELALSFLRELAEAGAGAERVFFLSAATDGGDGPTDAAGAFASGATAAAGERAGLDPRSALEANDSHAFLAAAGDLIVTGPTGTNVNDISLALIGERPPGTSAAG